MTQYHPHQTPPGSQARCINDGSASSCDRRRTSVSSKANLEGSMDGLDCSYRRTTLDFDPNAVLSPEQLLAFNFLPHPIWIFDFVERRHRWANRAGLRLWEANDLEELLQRDLSGMSPEAEARTRSAHLRVEQGLCIEDQWTIYPNGRPKTVFLSATGLRLSADEDHCCILCSAVPTMARETVVNETLRGNEMLQQLPMAICQFDMDGRVVYQNPASEIRRMDESVDQESHCSSISGDNPHLPQRIVSCGDDDDNYDNKNEHCEESSTISSSCSSFSENDFVERFVDPKVAQTMLQTIQTEDEVNLQAELHTSHGPQWSAIQLRKMNDPVTRKTTILFCSQDKTDAMEAKREREASMQKSEFLAIMAHEIRTPLHQVIGFIDLLIQTRLDPEQTSFVKLLKSSAQGLMTVISDVLDYSKLEAGQMNFECIPYEPLSVLQGSMAAVRSSCEEKGLFLTMDWSNRIPFRLSGDPNRLRQILLNLLSNAVKFTRAGGIHIQVLAQEETEEATATSVSAHTRRRGSSICSSESTPKTKAHIKFIIKDTGIGIPKENQRKIFEKYQQGNLSVARNYGGTGLGLSICQLLTERMGGSIGVESTVGQGSSFWVALPIEVPHESPFSLDQSDRSLVEEAIPLNILIAEDNLINQKLLKSMLTRFGYESTVAQNGKEAIEMVQKGTYDLVFMDIQMPVMDGLEATRRLRSMGYSKLPIYGLTASVKHSDYSDLGFDDWLPKPIPMNELKMKLLKLAHTKREQRTTTLR